MSNIGEERIDLETPLVLAPGLVAFVGAVLAAIESTLSVSLQLAVHCLHPPHHTLHTTHYTLHNSHYALNTTHYTLITTHYTLHTTHCTLHTSHCTLHTAHYALHTTHYVESTLSVALQLAVHPHPLQMIWWTGLAP